MLERAYVFYVAKPLLELDFMSKVGNIVFLVFYVEAEDTRCK